MAEQFFVDIFSTIKARDAFQTVLDSAWKEKNVAHTLISNVVMRENPMGL